MVAVTNTRPKDKIIVDVDRRLNLEWDSYFSRVESRLGTLESSVTSLQGAVSTYEFISTASIGAVASIAVALPIASGYDAFRIHLSNVRFSTDNDSMNVRLSDDGGATFEAGASDYAWGHTTTVATSTAVESDDADTEITIGRTGAGNGIGNAAGEYLSVAIECIDFDSANPKIVNWDGHYKDPSTRMCTHRGSGTFNGNTNPINYIQFLTVAATNFAGGKIVVFGIRYS